MTVFFIALALIGYLGFLIDWKELRGVLRQGGWAAACIYCIIAILIYAVFITPTFVATTGMVR